MKYSMIFKLFLPGFIIFIWYSRPEFQAFLRIGFQFLRDCDFYGLREYLLAYGAVAPLLSIVLMTLQSVVPFLPGMILTLTNAWLFGWLMGSVYSGIGALCGAILDFYIARWYGRSCFEHLAGEHYVQKINAYVHHHGALAVLITRLVPIIPFKVVSYSAGLSKMRGRVFVLVTFFGQMPGILLYSILGERLWDNIAAFVGINALMCVFAVLFFRMKKFS